MKYLFLYSIFFVYQAAHAESASDKYCGLLANMAKQEIDFKTNGDLNEQLDALIKVSESPLEDQAIKQNMTFEQFQAFAKSRGLTVSNSYKTEYIGDLAIAICGQIRTDATVNIRDNRSTTTSSTAKAEHQFDPTGRPYYNQMTTAH